MIGPSSSVAHADPFSSTALCLLRAVRAGGRFRASGAGAAASSAFACAFACALLGAALLRAGPTCVLARGLLRSGFASALTSAFTTALFGSALPRPLVGGVLLRCAPFVRSPPPPLFCRR